MLKNDSILLTMRTGACCRLQARSDDNGKSWVDARLTPTLHPGGLTAGITRMGRRVFVSNSYGNIRANMTVSVSDDDGNTYRPFFSVFPLGGARNDDGGTGPAAYSTIEAVPASMFGQAGLLLAYERGVNYLDFSKQPMYPYDFLTVAFIPVDDDNPTMISESLERYPSTTVANVPPTIPTDSTEREEFVSLGFWCHRHDAVEPTQPDLEGMFDNHDLIAVALPPVRTADWSFGDRLTDPVGNASLANGSSLPDLRAVVQWGNVFFGRPRFVLTEQASISCDATASDAGHVGWFDRLVQESAAWAASNSTSAPLPPDLQQYVGVCSALKSVGAGWLMLDIDAACLRGAQQSGFRDTTALGLAQLVHSIRSTCSSMGHELKIIWRKRAQTGDQPFLFEAVTTHSHGEASRQGTTAALVDRVDFVLMATRSSAQATREANNHFFSAPAAPFTGECNEGYDAIILDSINDSAFRIPAHKIVIELSGTSTRVSGCEQTPQTCDSSTSCTGFSSWSGGAAMQQMFTSLCTGSAEHAQDCTPYRYDSWGQQALFSTNSTFVVASTAQVFDFQLRHLMWRGVGGIALRCADDDYDHTLREHVGRPSKVFQQFTRGTVFSLGLQTPISNLAADSICRLFGSRAANDTSSSQQVAATCWGNAPTRSAAFPFVLRDDATDAARFNRAGSSTAAAEVFLVTTKSLTNISTIMEADYLRETPMIPEAAAVLAAALNATVANASVLEAAAAAGAQWCLPGMVQTVFVRAGQLTADFIGRAPCAGNGSLTSHPLKMFDGGTVDCQPTMVSANSGTCVPSRKEGLGGVVLFGPKLSEADGRALNADPASPFYITPWNSHRWQMKTDDAQGNTTAHVAQQLCNICS
jgi:hypothetical protein